MKYMTFTPKQCFFLIETVERCTPLDEDISDYYKLIETFKVYAHEPRRTKFEISKASELAFISLETALEITEFLERLKPQTPETARGQQRIIKVLRDYIGGK